MIMQPDIIKYDRTLALIGVLLIIITVGSICSTFLSTPETSEKIPGEFDPYVSLGPYLGFGLFSGPDRTEAMPIWTELENNESLKTYLHLESTVSKPFEFEVLCLDDFTQVPFSLGDNGDQLSHKIELEAMAEVYCPLEIANISAGTHDIAVILVQDPYNHSTDPFYRIDTESSVHDFRFNVSVAGDASHPEAEWIDTGTPGMAECSPDYYLNDGLQTTPDACDSHIWYVENTTPGTVVPFWINLAGGDDYPVTFALVALMDYRQVPLKTGADDYVIFGKLDTAEKVAFPASFTAPFEEGVHEFMVLWLPMPYEYPDEVHRQYNIEKQNNDICSNMRIAVNVTGSLTS